MDIISSLILLSESSQCRMLVLLISLSFIQEILGSRFDVTEYTHVSKALDGTPCLTGCSENNYCVINWAFERKNCSRTLDVAPIYSTSQLKDSHQKHCFGNCGYFGESYEWCITTEDMNWDYCTSYDSSTFHPSGDQVAKTVSGEWCTDKCGKASDTTYYWCHCVNAKKENTWNYCAPPSLPRIPVLQKNYDIGKKIKGKCNSFLNYISNSADATVSCTVTEARDNYVVDLAEAIEKTGVQDTLSRTFIINEANSSIQSYTMTKIGVISVPTVIRAHVTRESTYTNQSDVSEDLKRKVREIMVGNPNSFEAGHIIGVQLGGSSKEYNIVPRASCWRTDDWWDMELAIRNWCRRTNGSVDMLVVVFYPKADIPVPEAFGVSLVFKNPDNSLFVDCADVIHGNFM